MTPIDGCKKDGCKKTPFILPKVTTAHPPAPAPSFVPLLPVNDTQALILEIGSLLSAVGNGQVNALDVVSHSHLQALYPSAARQAHSNEEAPHPNDADLITAEGPKNVTVRSNSVPNVSEEIEEEIHRFLSARSARNLPQATFL